ncbi:hypothetical protein EVA_20950 [gut metagenome]|uniref:Uncharacterized protein n=1 Tax=gut metagenome TaxID=749906 RepID=J9FMW0_9ZZZZ
MAYCLIRVSHRICCCILVYISNKKAKKYTNKYNIIKEGSKK